MKICFYRAFPDDYRQSMTLYADELMQHILPLTAAHDHLEAYLPSVVRTRPDWFRYFSQYFIYQLAVSQKKADVHHIIDHSYAHLLHSLPAHKTVITFHDAIGLDNTSGLGRNLLHRYNLAALKKAGALLFDSKASRNALLNRISYPEEKAHLIYPGLDPLFFEAVSENPFDALGITPGLYMLHVGHTGAYKNIPALFHTLAEVRKQGMNIKLLKTGMPFTEEQNGLANDLKITPYILHLGLLRRDQMPLVYRTAQCLVFPSLNEGFGFPVLEAMASGLPVVSSNRGSLPEISVRADLLFSPEDYTGMSRAIIQVIENSSFRKILIDEGKSKAGEFQWRDTAKKVLQVYQGICV